ncbi:hypothetical protein OHB24_21400 [Kribbella sp. NBC_00482]|uniref:hypothetical protein n=1 Tax=Kribbella sp. NBC_00482 TaxID=2975968 RepID=UPI002E19A767
MLVEFERRRLEFELRYVITDDPSDKADDLAAYLGIDGLDWLAVTPTRPLLASEPDGGGLIVSTALA